MQNLEKLIEEYNQKKVELTKILSKEIYGYFKDLMDTHGVVAIRWTQYTPYFNDGEPCVFRVYSDSLAVQFQKGKSFLEKWDIEPKKKKEAVIALQEALDAIPKEIMFMSFGDHAQVTISESGPEISEYDHD